MIIYFEFINDFRELFSNYTVIWDISAQFFYHCCVILLFLFSFLSFMQNRNLKAIYDIRKYIRYTIYEKEDVISQWGMAERAVIEQLECRA